MAQTFIHTKPENTDTKQGNPHKPETSPQLPTQLKVKARQGHPIGTSTRRPVALELFVRILAILVARFAIEGALAAELLELPLGLSLCIVRDVYDMRDRLSFAS